jgi:hypothetical protein
LADADPTSASSVSWTVTFNMAVTGVTLDDFALQESATLVGSALTTVTGSGTTWTVTASMGTGYGTLGLNLVDNNSITDGTYLLGGAVIGDGNFSGDFYTILPPPLVTAIDLASFDPTSTNTTVSWTVTFNDTVTGVDASDFFLVEAGGASGATITTVNGSATTWTVSANTGTGTSGTLGLNLVDNDTIVNASLTPLGDVGTGNGDFNGQIYTLLSSVCTGAADVLFCDDFERASPGSIGNGWTITPAAGSDCGGVAGNSGCAGIDSDIPPFDTYTNPRANPTRSMFTRWSVVSVDSQIIDLSGLAGAQFSFWMRRGGDAFSEYPELAGENYLVEYIDSVGVWHILAQYPSGVMQGQVFTPTIELPPEALHANFQLRFYQPSGSGDANGGATGGAPGVVGYDYWHLDNVIIRNVPAPTFTGAFCDTFEGGLGRWSVTAEGAPVTAAIGDASIGSLAYQSATHELDMRWGYVSAATFKTDLTGVTGNISYWVRSGITAAQDPDTGEDLIVEYQNDVGNWINLDTFPGSAAAGTPYTRTHALPADALHTDFRLRFHTLNGSDFDNDYWHVDDVCVGDPIPTADLALTKAGTTLVPGTTTTYSLNVTNIGPGTLAGSVEIVDTLPTGLSYLAHSGTGWTCGANNQIVTCNWSGTLAASAAAPPLTLTASVSGSASGTITNTAVLSGTVVDNVPGNNTASYTTTIYVPAYVFTDKACTTGTAIGSGASACNIVTWSPQTAGTAQGAVYITALDASGVPTQLNATNPTTIAMQFALSCHDPIANAGIQASFPSSTDALPLCAASGATPTTWSAATSLIFAAGAPSIGPYSFNYDDVGSIELFMRNSAATSQIGSSGPFVVKPAGFVLTEIKPTANPTGRCAVNTTPAPTFACASDASGEKFVKAGESFSVTVTAVNAAGNATPNYGKEASPEGVLLTPALVAGLGLSQNPAVTFTTGFSGFTNGVATATDFSWGEVGILTLTPSITDADYLGAGEVTGTAAGPVGRFYPDHFDIAHSVTPSCGATFTYAGLAGSGKTGQPFAVAGTVTAKNTANSTTQNYAGAFAKLITSGITSAPWVGGGSVTDSLTWSVNSLAFTNGVGDFAENDASYAFTGEGVPQSMYLHISADDGEATGAEPDSSASLQATSYRFGRMRLMNAYGPELIDISVPFQAEIFSSNDFYEINTDDGCTTLTLPVHLELSVDNGANWVTGDNSVSVGGGTTSATLVLAAPLSLGKAGLSFSAPGAGNTGYVDLRTQLAASFPWLLFDWDGDGTQDEASGRVNFGLYSGSPRHIYLRELY